MGIYALCFLGELGESTIIGWLQQNTREIQALLADP